MDTTALDTVIAFLLGEGGLDGRWFGDQPPAGRGPYWWRRHLREAATRLRAVAGEPVADSVEQISKVAAHMKLTGSLGIPVAPECVRRWGAELEGMVAALGNVAPVLWVNPSDLADPYFVGINAAKLGHQDQGKHYTLPLYTRPQPATPASGWMPIAEAPKVAPWWLVWSAYYQRPIVVTCRMDNNTYWEGDWDCDVEATHFWQPLPTPNPEQPARAKGGKT